MGVEMEAHQQAMASLSPRQADKAEAMVEATLEAQPAVVIAMKQEMVVMIV